MNEALFERIDQLGPDSIPEGFAIALGTVANSVDGMLEGRVQVKVPGAPYDMWARLSVLGGAAGRGFCWIPQYGDEVLVAFSHNDPNAAYVLGGLWSTVDRPPLTLPSDFQTKRVIKTGVAEGVGHEVEFDDALQSITITSSTMQKVTIDPLKIELKNTAGTLSITLDNTTQTISLQAAVKLELKAPQISIEGLQVELKGTTIDVQAAGPCTVTGLPIKLN